MGKPDSRDNAATAPRKAIFSTKARTIEPPPGGSPLPPELDEILQIFRDVTGKRWREPAPDAVRGHLADIAHLLLIAHGGVDAFLDAPAARNALDAIRTLLATLPGLLTNAETAAEQGRRHGLPSIGDWLAWRGKELVAVLEPWRKTLGPRTRPDKRRGWHWLARALALHDVPSVIRAGTAARRASLTKKDAPAVVAIQRLLSRAGTAAEAAAIVKALAPPKGGKL